MDIKRILVATDLSERAAALYTATSHLAARLGARVDVVHVTPAVRHGARSSDQLDAYFETIVQACQEGLASARKTFRDAGVDVETEIRSGLPAEEILRAAEDADLIVIAKRKVSGLTRLLMGSTTKRIVRHSDKPVLVIDAHAGPLTEVKTVLAPTDLSEDSQRGLRWATNFVRAFDAHLEAVHVFKWPMVVPIMPGDAPALFDAEKIANDLRRFYEGEVKETTTEISEDLSYHVVVNADVAGAVMESAQEHDADLVVIPTHGKGGVMANLIGSTSERILEVSNLPVLVLPRRFLRSDDE